MEALRLEEENKTFIRVLGVFNLSNFDLKSRSDVPQLSDISPARTDAIASTRSEARRPCPPPSDSQRL
ncbi:hypothetical protein EVAR_16918_1 [Eumeta japonica]|uniref:Uncharacterized protein n=1 Tax=Eumeta variegata TaxID=151549 RepID=A0A4C1TWE8_EUMVA|nr:hypothetical protein EVAR_16918_1 [Eumeta japonica]